MASLNLTLRSPRLTNVAAAVLVGTATALGLLWALESLKPEWIVAVLLGALVLGAAVLSGRFERILLGLIFLLLPINPDINFHTPGVPIGTFPPGISTIDIFLGLLYVAWMFRLVTRREETSFTWPLAAWPALFLIGWAALSIINAAHPEYSLWMLFTMVKSFLLFFYLANHITTRRDIALVVACLLAGLLFESLFCFAQQLAGRPLGERTMAKEVELEASRVYRVSGTLGHPNALGGYLTSVIPVAMAVSLAAVTRRLRSFAVLAFGMGSVSLVLSYCRSAWIGVAVAFFAFAAWLLADRRRRRRLVPVLGMGLVLLLVIGAFAPLVMARWTSDDDGSTVSRWSQFKMAWLMVEAHPWLGVGLNNYCGSTHLYETYVDADKMGMVFLHIGRVHNVFLMAVAEMGLPCFVWFAGFMLMVTVRGWRTLHRARDELVRFALMGLLLSLVATILHDGFHTGSLGTNLYLWTHTAILVAAPRALASSVDDGGADELLRSADPEPAHV